MILLSTEAGSSLALRFPPLKEAKWLKRQVSLPILINVISLLAQREKKCL